MPVDSLSDDMSDMDMATGPLLNAMQLDRAKWYYSIDEAMREPDQVYKLSLTDQGLKSVPGVITQLVNLQVLNLSENRIKTLPTQLNQLKNLQVINVSNNRLKYLPDELKELDHLTQLYLGRNRLIEVPAWVGGLGKLRRLDLSANLLTEYEIQLVQYRLPRCEVTH